ncbi:ABC transporter substrate-binding protein [Streptomyces nymphaeiformis]|uniref:Multiple sugar transport system substrate-binding protein n=1 Tax=Streptomyces nymphaeiformis TaxID=2663842 RepID=A0A7W7TX96_9ACTN|nr:extracellular solute-binding protein [Streptomyces nymphaeiformis]MBB4980938.1 multiple sugar transport system substrate-binding protein [Streptomyces nymphaeiformis]
MRTFTHRSAAAAAALSLALMGTGCSGSDSPGDSSPKGPVSMEFWGWAPGYDKITAQWNAAHPDIKVTFKQIPSGAKGGYDQMTNAITAGKAPCLAQVAYSDIPSMLVKNALMDITPYASGDTGTYLDWAVAASSAGGKVYGIPVDTGPMALYYRTDLFKKFGIAKPPTTWEEYAADAAAVHKADPSVAFGTAPQDAYDMSALTWQTGKSWFGTSGGSWKVAIDNPGTQQVATYWQGLKDRKLVMNNGNAWDPTFNKASEAGKVMTFVNASWAAAGIKGDLKDLAGKWAVAPMPTWASGDKASANSGGSATSVLTGCKTPEQAEQFAAFLSGDKEAIGTGITVGGLYPASKAGLDHPLLSQGDPYFGGQKIYDVFKQSAANTPSTWVAGPTFGQIEADYTDAIGKGGYAQATTVVQQKTIDKIKSLGLSVSGN